MIPTMLIVCIAVNTCTSVMKEFPSPEACEQFAVEYNIPKESHTCKPLETLTQAEVLRLWLMGSVRDD